MLSKEDKERTTRLSNTLKETKLMVRKLEKELLDESHKLMPKEIHKICSIIFLPDDQIRIVTALQNIEDKEEFMNIFGYVNGNWDLNRRSVTYFRICNVLMHEGGGWILLNDKQPCSDEEWKAIKAGNIPEKFRNDNIEY